MAKIYQIVIEGHDAEQMQDLFEEIQNRYRLYDNCVLCDEVDKEDTIIDECIKDKFKREGALETGGIYVNPL